ncbi:amidase [Catellatospora sp. TT07R-123]|uniref:acetamidase/formamidase family protein n=1 Tax=Catellatospora sp. TT07R-123 TaxID=2733863 RepID=UPI001B20D9CA|nr:acetamidase/formamidase family protein [Catellatospora sp. TT07R-123]GHJ49079.1 amidase [Catellatospora sp. TT07R-123]
MSEFYEFNPTPEQYAYTFGPNKPLARVRPGDVLKIRTEDCFGGLVRGFGDLPSQVCTFPYLNPVTGPFYVEGAEPGDTLALHFVSITPARDWAVSSTFPHFGALTATSHTAMLHPPLEERVWVYEIDKAAGIVRYSARNSDFTVDLPLDPMHGTVGVAPGAFESRMTITPDAHGGNMDTPELRAGTTVYFGVNVEGALFGVGDGHARQGQGEVSGVAVEAAMETVVAVELIKGVATAWPRIESDTHLISTGSARPLEDAYRISQHDLVTWVSELTGLDLLDSLQLVTQAGEAPVGNVVDTNYTMVAKLAKDYLGRTSVYEGVHARLRALGAQYR